MRALLAVPLPRGFQSFDVYLCDTCADPYVLATRLFLWPGGPDRHFCDVHAADARRMLAASQAVVDDVLLLGQPLGAPVAIASTQVAA